jgi:methionyl-tRNA formyltransferase
MSRTDAIRVVFLCGHESRYGRAHLKPLLEAPFRIEAVVLASEARWDAFHERLRGGPAPWPAGLRGVWQRFRHRRERRRWRREAVRFAEDRGITVVIMDDVNSADAVQRLQSWNADVLFVAAYPQILSAETLATARRGGVNSHPSLLPKLRGAHPHFWAIAKGEEWGGLSAHFMTPRLDDGDVVAQIRFPILEYDYEGLYGRLCREVPALLAKVHAFLSDPNAVPSPQDSAQASYVHQDGEADHRIQWSTHTATDIRHLARTRKAYALFRGRKVLLRDVSAVPGGHASETGGAAAPGTILDVSGDGLVVRVQGGCAIVRHVVDGRRSETAVRWYTRARAGLGERLE